MKEVGRLCMEYAGGFEYAGPRRSTLLICWEKVFNKRNFIFFGLGRIDSGSPKDHIPT